MFNEPPNPDQDRPASHEVFVRREMQSGRKSRFRIIQELMTSGLSLEEAHKIVNRVAEELNPEQAQSSTQSWSKPEGVSPSPEDHEAFVHHALRVGNLSNVFIAQELMKTGLSSEAANEIIKKVIRQRYPQPKISNAPASTPTPSPTLPDNIDEWDFGDISPHKLEEPLPVTRGTLPAAKLNRFWLIALRLIALILTTGLIVAVGQSSLVIIAASAIIMVLFVVWKRPFAAASIARNWIWSGDDLSNVAPLSDYLDQSTLSGLIDELAKPITWRRKLVIAQILWQSQDKRAVPILSDMLDSENGYIVTAAANSLAYLATPDAISALRTAFSQQRVIPAKQAIGNALVKAHALSDVELAYTMRHLIPRAGCVGWFVAWYVVIYLFALVVLIAFGLFASDDIKAYYDVSVRNDRIGTELTRVAILFAVLRGLWQMRPWSLYLLAILIVVAGCALLTLNVLAALIVFAFPVWMISNRHRFERAPVVAVPSSQGIGWPTEDSEKLTRLVQFHRWLVGLSVIAALLGGLVVAPQTPMGALILVAGLGALVTFPNWRVYRKLHYDGAYVPWGTGLTILTMILLLALVGLTLAILGDLLTIKVFDRGTALSVGLILALILGLVLTVQLNTWGAGRPLGALPTRTSRYLAVRWGAVLAIMIFPIFLTLIEPSFDEFSERVRDAVDPPDATRIAERLENRIQKGHDAADDLNERWAALRQGELVYCDMPDIPVRIQLRKDIAEGEPDLAVAIALYDNGVDLLHEARQSFLDGCLTEFTLNNMLEGMHFTNGAKDAFVAAENAINADE